MSGIYSIDDLRRTAPAHLRNASEGELLMEYSRATGVDPRQAAKYLGVRTGDDVGVLRSGFSSGVDQLQGLGYSALGGAADAVGFDRGRDWANRRADINQTEASLNGKPELERIQDQSMGSALPFLGYHVAKQAPMIATIAGAQFVPGMGPAAGKLGLTRLAAVAPAAIGGGGFKAGAGMAAGRAALSQGQALATGTMAGSALGYGSLYQESVEGGDPSPYKAAALAPFHGLANAAVPSALQAPFRVPGAAFTGNLLQRGLKAGALASAGEGATETLQNEMEMSMRSDLTGAEKLDRRVNAAALGAIVGGAYGTVGGIPRARTLPPDETVDSGTADLLSNPPPAPLGLGWSGYDTGVGEIVSMPDGSAMLRSDYEAMMRTGQRPDGSLDFVPPAMSDVLQRSEPYEYEGAVPFENVPIEPRVPTGSQLQIPDIGLDGAQRDLFSLEEAPLNQFSQLPQQPEPGVAPDTQTRGIFEDSPSALVPTMFNPLDPSSVAGTRGAVAGNIRSQLAQQLGGSGDMTLATQLSFDIAAQVGNLEAMTAAVDARQQAVEKALQRLDRKVTDGSDQLDPQEYARQRELLDNKLLTIEAARELLLQYQRAQTRAYAEEGLLRAQPGQTVDATQPAGDATEAAMREDNRAQAMAEAVAETDQRVQQGQASRTAEDRMQILRDTLAQPTRSKPVARFREALRAQGYTNLDITPDEQAEIDRITQRRDDVRAATVVPPGLAAAQGRLTPRASLDAAQPEPTQPAAEAAPVTQTAPTGGAPVVGAGEPRPTQSAPAPAPAPAPALEAEPAGAPVALAEPPARAAKPKAAPQKATPDEAAATVDQLIERVENETDAVLYDGAVDALYRRHMDGTDADSDAILDYVQGQGKAFEKDWAQAEKRYDDANKTRRSKKKDNTPLESSIDKDTLNTLNGVWTRFSQGSASAEGKPSVTLERVKQIAQKVLDRLGIAGVVRIETYRNPAEAGLTPPDGIVPAGVTLDGGRILLFSDHIASDVDAFRTVFHELFHLGLSKTVGPGAYIQQMLKFKLDPLVRKYAERWKGTADGQNRKEAMPVNNFEALAVEEALADIAEDLATDRLGSREMNRFARAMVERLAQLAQFVGLGDVAQSLRRMTYSNAEKFVMDTLMGANYAAPTQLRGGRFSSDVTKTPAFKRWFGDSKVVGADGKPLVVYHGTAADVKAFQADKPRTSGAMHGAGFYFADAGTASAYADGDGANVMPVYLKMENPFMGELSPKDIALLRRTMPEFEAAYKKHLAEGDPSVPSIERLGVLSGNRNDFIQNALRAAGYDGRIVTFEPTAPWSDPDTEYIVFEPTQIKSAIGNNGNFDPTNPDIRFRQATTGNPKADKIGGQFSTMMQAFAEGASDLGLKVMFTRDLLTKAKQVFAGDSAKAYEQSMDRIEVEYGKFARQVDAVLEQFTALPAHLRGTGPGSVNGLIKASTESKEWAFEPDWLPKGGYSYKADSAVAKAYQALPKQAQAVVRSVFRHGYDTRTALQRALVDHVRSEYDVLIAQARQTGDTAGVKEHEAAKKVWLDDFKALFDGESNWPYAPLRRFGKHVVMGVSQEYMEAKGDHKRQREMESDGRHYFVAFAETKAQAIRMEQQIKGQYADVGHFERLSEADGFLSGRDVVGAFQRLRKVVQASAAEGLAESSSKEMDNLMRQVYLQLLSENSARKAEMNRKTVAGADPDMMRSFATNGRATAHFIAKIKANSDAVEHLHNLGEEVRDKLGGRAERQAIYNEIMRRHTSHSEFNPDGFTSKVMATTSVWMLLSKPAYYLQNMTQPWMMSHPLMAAKHGYTNAANQLLKAYKDLVPALKDGAFKENDYDKLPADVREAITKLADMGAINISLESVLGKFESTSNAPTQALDIVSQKLSGAAQTVESMNRLSTAIAAYRMELASQLKAGAPRDMAEFRAVKYAEKVIYETHGDYSSFNAPRFMRSGLGRLATQFRKFQLIQLSMFARFVRDAFKGATPAERTLARRALAFNLAHLGALGGLMAMPGFTAAAWVLGAAFGDDDEPNDAEAKMRRAIGDKQLADFILKGIPKALGGPDTSSWIGAGGMLSIMPYTEIKTGQEGYKDMLLGLAGPAVGGIGPRVADGMQLWKQGDYWRGLEQMLPAGVSGAMKSVRFGGEGVTRRNGDVLLSPDEISVWDLSVQALGLTPGKVVDRNQVAASQFKADDFYRNRTTQLKKRYTEAVRGGDEPARREAIEEWQQTQEARRRLGYKTQPLSELLKAPAEQRERERDTRDGVQYRSNNEQFSAALL